MLTGSLDDGKQSKCHISIGARQQLCIVRSQQAHVEADKANNLKTPV